VRDITEPDWPNLPHAVKIESYYAHTGTNKAIEKVFDTEAEAIAFARLVTPEELRPQAEACRYDEVMWQSCHMEWCVSISLHLPSIVDEPRRVDRKSLGYRIGYFLGERCAYVAAWIGDKLAPELPAGHPEFNSRLDIRDAEAHGK
jgi:hypothetical protein